MAKKVLVVDDEKLIVKGIRFSLEQDGMEVDCAYDGEEALKMATENHYDMILLDIMLPKMDGFEVCQHIREFSDMPIVMLTAKGDDMDKILGLEYGADDYITKPFNILEVKARIKAIMRRTAGSQPKKEDSKVIEAGDLRLDCESRRLFILNKEVICSILYGVTSIRGMSELWMCMSDVSERRSKRIQASQSMFIPSGVWDTTITRISQGAKECPDLKMLLIFLKV